MPNRQHAQAQAHSSGSQHLSIEIERYRETEGAYTIIYKMNYAHVIFVHNIVHENFNSVVFCCGCCLHWLDLCMQ